MDQRRTDPLTDAVLDRILSATLAVEPSPDFVAQVRTRAAGDQALSLSTFVLLTGALAVAASLVMVVGVGFWRRDAPQAMPPARESVARQDVVLPAEQTGSRDISPVITVSHAGTPPKAVHRTRQPDVLISTDEILAIRQLVAGVTEGQFELSFESTPAVLDQNITIAPISIEPLDASFDVKGVGQ